MNYPAITPLQRFYYIAVILIALSALFWVALQIGQYLSNLVMMIGLVLIFTYLLLAPVNSLHKGIQWLMQSLAKVVGVKKLKPNAFSKVSRISAILSVYIGVFLVGAVVLVTYLPMTVVELSNFVGEMPEYSQQVEDWVNEQPWVKSILNQASIGKHHFMPANQHIQLKSHIEMTAANAQQFLMSHVNETLNNILAILSTTLSGVLYTLTGLVLLFYFLLDGHKFKHTLVQMFPSRYRQTADYMMCEFHHVMFGFIKGQVILGIATGIFMFGLYTFASVPFALVLGVWSAIAEIIPVVGTWIGFTPGIIVMIFMGKPLKLFAVMGICYVYQTIKDNIVAPKVIGDRIGLHPIVIILSLLVCGQIGGLLGVIYAIPIASMVNVGWRCIVANR